MIEFPQSLKLEVLEAVHPEYQAQLPYLQKIDLLVAGGHKLEDKIKEFLPQRPGEDDLLYETRLKKFTYNNILGSAISQQTSRLSNGTISISGIENNVEFWNAFRENTDLAGRAESSLISYIFRECLKFKRVYLHIDKPKMDSLPQNKFQEELLGIRPYVVVYSALQVTNWSENRGNLKWIKVRQVVQDTSNPLAPPLTQVVWTFITNTYIARYKAYVELARDGSISNILNNKGEKVSTKDADILLDSVVAHGVGSIPVIKVEIPNELWACDQAAPKALEHLRTDCSKYDLQTMAYFQRTFKRVMTPDGDINATYQDSMEAEIPTGLQHVLELDKFEWSEPQGHILTHLRDTLNQIENQVRDMVALGGVSAEKGVIQQSGVSKRVDFYHQENVLKQYGRVLTDAYQDLLQLIARIQNISDEISVSGLNNFDLDNIDSLLENFKILSDIDFSQLRVNLPPTAFRLKYQQLLKLMLGNISAEDEELITQEIETNLYSPTIVNTGDNLN
ncbi:hypothetical protein Nos7524_3195 [Nostoc sp. PCC 7524]|uniref:hypothetical protein n=1 Tax=Nostoc sp. (strain ATCC 29411 / PCC 7524) TaxID=28072 RepID=UPI00029F2004|nr:hypothetical protein [Nostoc sp. PCC 7524]AFY48995.1 hypothetical protein Nos7524_3195 [Nostoc sp. PCC 7524]